MKKRSKTSGGIQINIHLTNRWLYALVSLGILVLVTIGVYAVTATSGVMPGITPNPGHSISEIGAPQNCASGEFLQYIVNGNGVGTWTCTSPATPPASLWNSFSGNNIYYDKGTVYVNSSSFTGISANLMSSAGISASGEVTGWAFQPTGAIATGKATNNYGSCSIGGYGVGPGTIARCQYTDSNGIQITGVCVCTVASGSSGNPFGGGGTSSEWWPIGPT